MAIFWWLVKAYFSYSEFQFLAFLERWIFIVPIFGFFGTLDFICDVLTDPYNGLSSRFQVIELHVIGFSIVRNSSEFPTS
jgi:hypothetical protein